MKPRVLIVDDEPDVLELVEFKLSGEGFEVIRAATGIEALQQARCGAPDVIVLDVMLPDVQGLSLCEILRAQPSTRDIPVVILSELDPPAMRHRGAKVSVFRWLTKQTGFQRLGQSVRAALREHEERVILRFGSD